MKSQSSRGRASIDGVMASKIFVFIFILVVVFHCSAVQN
jgi:hypothetical protein